VSKDAPLCFVLMPFGVRRDPSGGPSIDFDAIYDQAIRPAVQAAGLEAIRADEERTGGIIHKPMFERLLLCDYVVADITGSSPSVFYELGVRHAARPATTLVLFAKNQKIPFDFAFLRALPYELAANNGFTPREAGLLQNSLTSRLTELRTAARQGKAVDSPIFQLLDGYRGPDVSNLKSDAFRGRVERTNSIRRALAAARDSGNASAISEIEASLGDFDGIEAGLVIEVFLSYRAVGAWDQMIALYNRMPSNAQTTVVRQQYALALNRAGRSQEAISTLLQILQEQGPNSETFGILGRVLKDRWLKADRAGDTVQAQAYLERAIESYVLGFETDWRDAYPGINAVTLLDIEGSPASEKKKAELLPVVQFAASQRLKNDKPDYWDYATLLELAVLASDQNEAARRLADALPRIREDWEPATTANNLQMIQSARKKRGLQQQWLDDTIAALSSPTSIPGQSRRTV
jgi:hypothetical protein